jgi:hypothetical protein
MMMEPQSPQLPLFYYFFFLFSGHELSSVALPHVPAMMCYLITAQTNRAKQLWSYRVESTQLWPKQNFCLYKLIVSGSSL